MSILRASLAPARSLARTLGPWPILALTTWALVLWLQEPRFFVRQDIPFFWQSFQVMLILVLASLPLVWRLSQGPEAMEFSLHVTRSSLATTATTWLGILLYGTGTLLLSGTIAILFALLRNPQELGLTLEATIVPCLLRALSVLLWTAALAPALAMLRGTTTTAATLWTLIVASGLHFLVPAEFSEGAGAQPLPSGIVSCLLATLGGLTVSLAQTNHRLRH